MREEIIVNGEKHTIDAPLLLRQLLEKHHIMSKGIAVAVNEIVIPKGKWEKQMIKPGDRIEVIKATQGG